MRLTLLCDGRVWQGWQSFTVTHSIEQLAHSFSFTTTDQYQEGLDRWNVRGGSEIKFYIDDILIVSGFVRKYNVAISDTSHSITIEGDSKAIDLLEASHLGPYYWPEGPAESVITSVLAPFGADLLLQKQLKPIPAGGYRVEVTESPYDIIKKLLDRDGLTIHTDSSGVIVATNSEIASNAGAIGRGDYTSISVDHDLTASFSEIIVKSQKNNTDSESKASFDSSQRNQKSIKNPSETRYRPIVFTNSGEGDAQEQLAQEIKSRFAGDTVTSSVTLKTHLDKLGNLWAVNKLVYLDEPLVYAKQSLLVSQVEFSLSESDGFSCNLELKVPASFNSGAPDPRSARTGEDGPFTVVTGAFNDQ